MTTKHTALVLGASGIIGRNLRSWTALRPDIVFGFAVGNPMNLGNLIAVYASLCKELGVPLRYPGSPKA